MQKQKKWIWEHEEYPNFKYSTELLFPKIVTISENIGKVKALISLLDTEEQDNIKVELLTNELVSTSAIEGEHLLRKSVRSSIRKKIDDSIATENDNSTQHTDALASLLIDSIQNRDPVTKERIHIWHHSLLTHASNNFTKISLGKFRDYDDMQIVSGNIGKEKIHYIGLPYKKINEDINSLVEYINNSNDHIYIKSAIAHLWFVTIHPYDDGNGRIARVISDYIVSNNFGSEYKYFSVSDAIAKDRKNYYDNLENTQSLLQNPDINIMTWIQWYLDRFNNSLDDTIKIVNKILSKTKFWDKIRDITLNQRQIKVLKKLLEYSEGEFKGGLTTKKYVAMTKTSVATAKRDIQELLKYKCLTLVEGTRGRNIRYSLNYK